MPESMLNSKSKYAKFAGQVLRKAWCTANKQLYYGEEPLSPEYILRIAEECKINLVPPSGFLKLKRLVEKMEQDIADIYNIEL